MKFIAPLFLAAFFPGLAYSQTYVSPTYGTYTIISIERDPEKIQCGSQWSDTIMAINLKNVADNSTGWVWVSTNKPAYKDVLTISLSALSTKMKVGAAIDANDARSCASRGKLISIYISNSL
jgi:hypothetical protein